MPKKEDKTKPVNGFRLPVEVIDAIHRVAKKQDRTFSGMMRRILCAWYTQSYESEAQSDDEKT